MRYYSRLRPVSIGTYPKYADNKVTNITNFYERQLVDGINVWGYLEYEHAIPEQDAYRYDLAQYNKE